MSQTSFQSKIKCRLCGKSELGHARQPYHSYVHSLSERWPQLKHLEEFLHGDPHSRGTTGTPNTRIAILEFRENECRIQGEFADAQNLSTFLQTPAPSNSSRLFLIQDISPDVVELLGFKFDVDPIFFSSHIYSLDWFSRVSSPTTVPLSKSMRRAQNFIHLRYLEARPVTKNGRESPSTERLPCFDSNVLRKVSLTESGSTRHVMGFARRHISIWMDSENENWTGKFNVSVVNG
jgi:hypothetical protein